MKNTNNKTKTKNKYQPLTTADILTILTDSITNDALPFVNYFVFKQLVSDIDEGKFFDLADLRDCIQSELLNISITEDLNSPSTNNKSIDLDVKIDNKVNLKKYIVPKNNKTKTTKNNN